MKEIDLIEEKILEMNQRLAALEINESKNQKTQFKRFRELNLEMEKYEDETRKARNNVKMYELEV